MLSSHAYYAFEVNLLFSNYADFFFSTQTKYLIFYCTEARQKQKYDRCCWLKEFCKNETPIILTGLKILAYYFSIISLWFSTPIIPKIMLA